MLSLALWLIYSILESPFMVALGIVLVLDEVLFGFRIRFFRQWRRNRRARKLEHLLATNSHDRRARSELAEILVDRGRFGRAVDVLKPNIEAGEHDAGSLLLMGRACSGARRLPQAEVFLEQALAAEPAFGDGAIDLALGEHWLRAGDPASAEEALRRFCRRRPGSIQGPLLLARTQTALGKTDESKSSSVGTPVENSLRFLKSA